MITRDPGAAGGARVIGSLTAETVQILLDAIDRGVAALDLAEVVQADDSAVRVLNRVRAERCTLSACPRWLELWMTSICGNATVQGSGIGNAGNSTSRPAAR
jgi:hypothetical protein